MSSIKNRDKKRKSQDFNDHKFNDKKKLYLNSL